MKTRYEWDPGKAAANLAKHGIDFADIPELFAGPHLVDYEEESGYGEDRQIAFGFIRQIVVMVVFTERSPNLVRIISARKATSNERKAFTSLFPH